MRKFALALVASMIALATSQTVLAQTDHVVVGTEQDDGTNVWMSGGKVSPPKAALDDPTDRLTINAKVGDTISFRVDGARKHGVIFEHAATEQKDGVWEKSSGPESLMPVNATFKDFDQRDAQTTNPVESGQKIITIKVKKPTGSKGILFGCNPHSKSGDPKKRSMLGVIKVSE